MLTSLNTDEDPAGLSLTLKFRGLLPGDARGGLLVMSLELLVRGAEEPSGLRVAAD